MNQVWLEVNGAQGAHRAVVIRERPDGLRWFDAGADWPPLLEGRDCEVVGAVRAAVLNGHAQAALAAVLLVVAGWLLHTLSATPRCDAVARLTDPACEEL